MRLNNVNFTALKVPKFELNDSWYQIQVDGGNILVYNKKGECFRPAIVHNFILNRDEVELTRVPTYDLSVSELRELVK